MVGDVSVNFDMVTAAAHRLKGYARRTPLLSSPFLDRIAGRRVFVKAECLQHTGSFKFRGAWSAITALPDTARGVVAFSSGNHAQGVAYAASLKGLPAVIIMPRDAPAIKIANTRALGAEVVLYDRALEDRDALGAALARERGLELVQPFDHPQVIAGQGSVGLEIAEQARAEGIEAAQVLVCCGGGGLTSGIALALEQTAPQMQVRTVEPEGFDDVAQSLATGQVVENPTRSGLCDAIVTPRPGALTWPVMQCLCGQGLVVSDAEALRAMGLAYERLKLVLEPGGAVALAAAMFRREEIEGDAVIVTASGGNVDRKVLLDVLAMGETDAKR
jgi:threonine dehydratase